MPIFLGYVVSYDAVICLRVSVMEAPLHILLSYVYGLRGGGLCSVMEVLPPMLFLTAGHFLLPNKERDPQLKWLALSVLSLS